jgi:hypothetical protein
MPTTFMAVHQANLQEMQRLRNLIRNLRNLRNVNNNSTDENWRNRFNNENIPRLQALYQAKKSNPNAYKISKLQSNLENVKSRRVSRLAMYGYIPKMKSNWVYKGMVLVPPNLPQREVAKFRRIGRTGPGSGVDPLAAHFNTSRWRNTFTAEGTLKAPSGKKPVPFVPRQRVRGFLPTLKELAWATKTSNKKFETVKTMNNNQLKLFSEYAPVNWTMLKPKRRANPLPENNVVEYRRGAAARVIQRAAKKYLKKTTRNRSHGFVRPRETILREVELGIGAGAHRASGPANNTRITWTRRANGKINRHKTLEKLNLNLSKNQRNALNKMSETNAMAYIRNLARAH